MYRTFACLVISLLLAPNGCTLKTAPPQITVQPVSVTAIPPAAATFTFAANGSNLTYKGMLNSTIIPCAVTTKPNVACTVSPTTVAMNGDIFTATISNSGGSITTSGVATLTINPAPQTITMAATFTLPQGTSGVAYSANIGTIAQVTANGTLGCSTCTYAVTSGTIPASLSLSTSGILSGTPAAVAQSTTTSFTITVTLPATAFKGAAHAKIYATLSIPSQHSNSSR
jgi:large repetitive protein